MKIIVIVQDRGTERLDVTLSCFRYRDSRTGEGGGSWGRSLSGAEDRVRALPFNGLASILALAPSGLRLWVSDSAFEPQPPPPWHGDINIHPQSDWEEWMWNR